LHQPASDTAAEQQPDAQLERLVLLESPHGQGEPAIDQSSANVGGQIVFGGTYPAQIWARIMSVGLAGAPAPDFAPPDPGLWPAPTFASEGGRGVAPAPATGTKPGPGDDKPKGRKK